METSLGSNSITNVLCQPNAPERARVTDDVTFRMLCCLTDICIENIVNPSVFTQNNGFIVQIMMHW